MRMLKSTWCLIISVVGKVDKYETKGIVDYLQPQKYSILFCLILLEVLTLPGCATREFYKAYPGQDRNVNELGIITTGIETKYLKSKYIAILDIDGNEKVGDWSGGFKPIAPLYLLPGTHRFRVEVKQTSQPTTIPIVSLFQLIHDASVAMDNVENIITFPVTAGNMHKIHYDENQHAYFVSQSKSQSGNNETATLSPTGNVVQCVMIPDKKQNFWCELH